MLYKINKNKLLEESLVISNKRPIAGLAGATILGAIGASAAPALIYNDYYNDLKNAYNNAPDVPPFPTFPTGSDIDYTNPDVVSKYDELKQSYNDKENEYKNAYKNYNDYNDNTLTPLIDKASSIQNNMVGAGVGLGTLGAVAGYRAGTKIYDAPTKR